MIVQEETKTPATTPEPEPEKKPRRLTKEEEIEWFKEKARTDLTARQLFQKRAS